MLAALAYGFWLIALVVSGCVAASACMIAACSAADAHWLDVPKPAAVAGVFLTIAIIAAGRLGIGG